MNQFNCQSPKRRFDSLNIKISSKPRPSEQNDENCHLPKISNFGGTPKNQKTLPSLIKRLQKFIRQCKGTSAAIWSECLQTLKQFTKINSNLPKLSILKTLPSESSNCSVTNKFDQIFAVDSEIRRSKREELKKIDSRQLLQKIRKVKQQNQNRQNSQVRENKQISTLKAKIDDQDKTIRALNETIEKQKLHVQNLKLTVHSLMKNDTNLRKEANFQQKLKELNDQISNLQKYIKDKEDQNLQQTKNHQQKYKMIQETCSQLREALKQRQNQLVSIWQIQQTKSIL